MSKLLRVTAIFFLLFCFGITAKTIEKTELKDICGEQVKNSGVAELTSALPHEVSFLLEKLGISAENPESISNLNIKNVFDEINLESKRNFKKIFSSLTTILGVLIVCAAVKSFVPSDLKHGANNTLHCICTLCVCSCVICPITTFISTTKCVVVSATNFTTALSAVMASIMVASGKPVSASSYSYLVLVSGQVISGFSSNLLLPIMNSLFGVSVISSISDKIKTEKLCLSAYKLIKSILKFVASMFVGILSLQNIVTSSVDNFGSESAKLIIDSCIPIVGSAVSDAFSTVNGGLKLLKSGVGAFGILAGIFIFLPLISECIIWEIFLSFCEFISESFELKRISVLFKSASEIIKTLLAILVCIIVVLISSTAIILIIGR